MIPGTTRSAAARSAPDSDRAASALNSSKRSTSSTIATIGAMTCGVVPVAAAARAIARSCATRRSGRVRPSRIPRTPRNGFASTGRSRYGTSLSPPISASRMTTGRSGPNAARTVRYARACSSSSGGRFRPRNRNSVRNSPTPSAPTRRARSASSGPPRFATRRIGWPSAVAPGRPRSTAARLVSPASAATRRSIAASSSAVGSISSSPVNPSSATVRAPSAASRETARSARPTTAGMPSDRARIAAWAVGEPPTSPIPRSSPFGISAAIDGGRSSASTIDGTTGRSSTSPVSARPIRAATSRTSPARAASSSSSSDSSWPAIASAASRIAWPGGVPVAIRSRALARSVSSRAISACASKIPASSGRPAPRSPSARAPSCAAAVAAASSRSTRTDPVAAFDGFGARWIQAGPVAAPGAAATPRIRTGQSSRSPIPDSTSSVNPAIAASSSSPFTVRTIR